jgi:L-alanine-DL-glutamate epimerase-like enolase superfamily enzyme
LPDSISAIAAVETTTVTLRAKPALAVRGPRTTHDVSSFLLVRVLTEDGAAGYGEVSATAAWSGEDAVTAAHFVRNVIAPHLIGRPLAPVAAHSAIMDRYLGGNPFTKAGVNTALWDALGRTLDLPVATLLGGPFRDEVPVKISLSGELDELRAGYEAAVSLGFRAFKIKVGKNPAEDVARVALVRELAGPDAFLGVDANGSWNRATAGRLVRAMASAGLEFVEQPVKSADLDGMRQVRSHGVPVVADEAVYSEADVLRVAQAEAADVISIYVGKSGGLERAVRAASTAALNGLEVVIGANGEMGIGAAAQTHVACACERLGSIPCGITGQHFYEDEPTLEVPVDIDGRRARLPAGPGLGVEPVEHVRRRFSA